MNESYMRGKIITYTIQQIKLHGIKKVRVDDIAKELGISKKTLYFLFTDKESLIKCCCLKIFSETGRKLLQCNTDHGKDESVLGILRIANCFITTLYQTGKILLSELHSDSTYKAIVEQEKSFWKFQFNQSLKKCKGIFCPATERDTEKLSTVILQSFYLNCINGYSYTSQLHIGYLLLRGLINCDDVKNIDDQIKYEWNKLLTIP